MNTSDIKTVLNTKEAFILVPNASSPKNVGDLAILESLLRLLRVRDSQAKIRVHSFDSYLYPKNEKTRFKKTLYYWAAFEDGRLLQRIVRMTSFLVAYVGVKVGNSLDLVLSRGDLHNLLLDYHKASHIVFVGNGYFRSKAGLTQTLNLLMHLAELDIAVTLNKSVIVSPISFGPFAYGWQEKLTANLLKKAKLVGIREDISYAHAKKHGLSNLLLTTDFALFLSKLVKAKSKFRVRVGFTIRGWLDSKKQAVLEQAYIEALQKLATTQKVIVQPIVQVTSDEYGDNDEEITRNISDRLKALKIPTLPIIKVTDLLTAKKAYGNLELLLGMRMHSTILAATQGTPFVAVSYEHKTDGIAKQIDMNKYCITNERVTSQNLSTLLLRAYKNRATLSRKMTNNLKHIQRSEQSKWNHIFTDFHSKAI